MTFLLFVNKMLLILQQNLNQKKMEAKKIKKACITGGIILSGGLLLGVCYVRFHKPAVVQRPCYRSFHRADGCPKVAYDTSQKANWQSIKQLLRHGEICNPYQVGNKYYTGHSKYALCKNINPFK